MLLDRIDIDAHGPLQRVELGPFAEHLNIVSGPLGSGKTAISRFIRDSLVEREYPLGMLSSSTGRIVWADRNGLVHCRREKDGTAQGRRTIEFESRGDLDREFGSLQKHSWLGDICSSTDSSRAVRSIQLPESIVDGVITDASVTSVARVVSACVRSGLDSVETYRSLPLDEESLYHDRDGQSLDGYDHVVVPGAAYRYDSLQYNRNRKLRQQLADVEAELARLGENEAERQSLKDRRHWLMDRLADLQNRGNAPAYRSRRTREYTNGIHDGQSQQRLAELHDRARDLRARQSELRRWIAEIDANIARTDARYDAHSASEDYRYRAEISDQQLRRNLDDLDAQMIRWRRALLEVRGLRSAIVASHRHFADTQHSPLDEATLRRLRLDGFLHAIDRYDRSRSWDDSYPESYRPIHRLDDIDHRIDSATRQIDWLLERYASPEKVQHTWYETLPASASYRSATTLGDTLRAVREDLRQIHRYTLRSTERHLDQASGELEEIRRSEQWLVAAIAQLDRHRESLIANYAASHHSEVIGRSHDDWRDHHVLRRDRSESIANLDRVTADLDACLREAAELRRAMRSLPIIDAQWYDSSRADVYGEYRWIDRDALTSELRRIEDRLAAMNRGDALRARRTELLRQLRVVRRPTETKSPLADAASSWLVRLSAGRLQRIDWPFQLFRGNANSYHREGRECTGVTINGRDETSCSAADRALASMAVRMAAGDLLARTGRHVPLVLETHPEVFANVEARHPHDQTPLAYYQHGDHFRSNHPIAAALRDYSRAGRQVIMLTSNQDLAAQLERVGARRFSIHAERIVHPHRPLWRPHYDAEHYVGPHPHTYGFRGADEVNAQATGYAAPLGTNGRTGQRECLAAVDINRDFDMAWREAYGFYDNPERSRGPGYASEFTDFARDGVDYRDGYYFADTYTTVTDAGPNRYRPQGRYSPEGHWVNQASGTTATGGISASTPSSSASARNSVAATARLKKPDSPFFLSVDSPIDQAPSIDAVAAARLRGLGVTHINHLMQHDSNRLSDAVGLASVDAATIRRWQAECRLVCRVPQLRGFDARVLVGCGVTSPAQLASIHPVDLLQEVEEFLATQQGQQILLSGSSHELSRITSWIAAANSSSDSAMVGFGGTRQAGRDRSRPRRRSYYRGFNRDDSDYVFDSDGYEYQEGDHPTLGRGLTGRRRRRIIRTMNQRDADSNSGGRGRQRRVDEYESHLENDVDGDADSFRNGQIRRAGGSGVRSRSSRSRRARGSSRRRRNGSGYSNGSTSGYGSASGSGNGSRRARTVYRSHSDNGHDVDEYSRRRRSRRGSSANESTPRDVVRYEKERTQREPRESYEYEDRESRSGDSQSRNAEHELRFYLQRDSLVVDAPSIGSRMADRLNSVGIETVNDLLKADPESLAVELDHRRTDADTIVQWQQQATLVCCVPMLRGHDAQLLVAAEVTTPDELASSDAEDLFGIVDPIARSNEGKRIVRGGKLPDLPEVTDWINYAQHQRALQAA